MISQGQLVLVQMNNGDKEILAEALMDLDGLLYLKYKSTDGRYVQFFWSENRIGWETINIGTGTQVDRTSFASWGYSPRAGFILTGKEQLQFKRLAKMNDDLPGVTGRAALKVLQDAEIK